MKRDTSSLHPSTNAPSSEYPQSRLTPKSVTIVFDTQSALNIVVTKKNDLKWQAYSYSDLYRKLVHEVPKTSMHLSSAVELDMSNTWRLVNFESAFLSPTIIERWKTVPEYCRILSAFSIVDNKKKQLGPNFKKTNYYNVVITGQLREAICKSLGSSWKSKHLGCTNLRLLVLLWNNRLAFVKVNIPRPIRALINLPTKA